MNLSLSLVSFEALSHPHWCLILLYVYILIARMYSYLCTKITFHEWETFSSLFSVFIALCWRLSESFIYLTAQVSFLSRFRFLPLHISIFSKLVLFLLSRSICEHVLIIKYTKSLLLRRKVECSLFAFLLAKMESTQKMDRMYKNTAIIKR